MPCPIVSQFLEHLSKTSPSAPKTLALYSELADEIDSLRVAASEWTGTLEVRAFVGLLFCHKRLFQLVLALSVESAGPYLTGLLNLGWEDCVGELSQPLYARIRDLPLLIVTNYQLKGQPRTTEQFRVIQAEKALATLEAVEAYAKTFRFLTNGKLLYPPLPVGEQLHQVMRDSETSILAYTKIAKVLLSVTKENLDQWKQMTAARLSFSD